MQNNKVMQNSIRMLSHHWEQNMWFQHNYKVSRWFDKDNNRFFYRFQLINMLIRSIMQIAQHMQSGIRQFPHP